MGPNEGRCEAGELPHGFGVTLSQNQFGQRVAAFQRQVYSSPEFSFDEVMTCVYRAPAGYVTVDPQLVHDGKQWHLFYVTGRLQYHDEWMAALRAGDWKRCRQVPYEEGDGHAVGADLAELKFHSIILNDPQGEYGCGLQGDSAIRRPLGQPVQRPRPTGDLALFGAIAGFVHLAIRSG